MIQNLVSLKNIITEKNSQVNYLEGCTAPQYDTNQLHAAVVELIMKMRL
jgi:Fe-S cluster assembly scaffold protein SufB